MLFVAGKSIFQTFYEKTSNRKLIGIGHLLSLTHHNVFGLFNVELQLLGQAEKRLLSVLFQYHIKFDNSFSDTVEIQIIKSLFILVRSSFVVFKYYRHSIRART